MQKRHRTQSRFSALILPLLILVSSTALAEIHPAKGRKPDTIPQDPGFSEAAKLPAVDQDAARALNLRTIEDSRPLHHVPEGDDVRLMLPDGTEIELQLHGEEWVSPDLKYPILYMGQVIFPKPGSEGDHLIADDGVLNLISLEDGRILQVKWAGNRWESSDLSAGESLVQDDVLIYSPMD